MKSQINEKSKNGFLTNLAAKLAEWNLTGNNLIYAIGCVVMVIASFLPYAYVEEKNLTLMDGNDGIFFLMFTVLILIFIAFEKRKVVGVLGVIMLYFGAYELIHTFYVLHGRHQINSVRAGYFTLLVGTIVILAASSYYIYRNGLKDAINKLFDKFSKEK